MKSENLRPLSDTIWTEAMNQTGGDWLRALDIADEASRELLGMGRFADDSVAVVMRKCFEAERPA